jgi:GT2 family glycosyltransferase
VSKDGTPQGVELFVLNYNGRGWLEECLPSVREAALRSPVPRRVTVVDNGSTDDSCEVVAR